MTRNKDLKCLVRARMRKTGEAYTAARAQIATAPKPAAKPASPPPLDFAKLAGMSDASIKAKTGCGWEKWTKSLDYYGASTMSHREIAALVDAKYETGPWWSQTVAVGYERIKGLRARGQQRNGTYQMTKSRTYDVPVSTLFDAWLDGGTRRKWLTGGTVRVRVATAPKSMRLEWSDGGIIAVGFTSKGTGKSMVALEHAKLPDRESAERLKTFWSERLDALREVLVER